MSTTGVQFDRAAINSIVREVLRRVMPSASTVPSTPPVQVTPPVRPVPLASATSVGQTIPPVSAASSTTEDSSYECDARVIALATLRGKLDDIQRLRVKPKTIVTPAVRDELRDRQIEIVFDLGADDSVLSRKLILLGTTCEATGARLRDELTGDGSQVQLLVKNSVNELAKTVGDKLSASKRALIITDKPYTAVCVANRNSNVQAAIVRDANEATATKQELSPNCVVLSSNTAKRINLTTILRQLNW